MAHIDDVIKSLLTAGYGLLAKTMRMRPLIRIADYVWIAYYDLETSHGISYRLGTYMS